MQAADVPARLAVATSSLDAPPPGTLLSLEEVPAGDYRLRMTRTPSARGELVLGIGRASVPAARWPLSAEQAGRFYLPVRASYIRVTGDAEALQSIENVALVPEPQARTPTETHTGSENDVSTLVLRTARARDAGRYGTSVVYTLDDRVWLEPRGFWVMGGRAPDVVIAMDHPVDSLEIDVRNGPGPNRLRIRAGAWSSERALGPDEPWHVRVPVTGHAPAIVVGFDVQRGFIPADIDPKSGDRRALGCWVEVR